MANRQKFSLEFREQAVRRVIDGPRPIVDVAADLKIHEGTLSNWVRQYRDEHPVDEKPLTPIFQEIAGGGFPLLVSAEQLVAA